MKKFNCFIILTASLLLFSCSNSLNSPLTEETSEETIVNYSQNKVVENRDSTEVQDNIYYFSSSPHQAYIHPLDDLSNELTMIFPTWRTLVEEALEKELTVPKSYSSMAFRVVLKPYCYGVFCYDGNNEEGNAFEVFQYERCSQINQIVSKAREEGKNASYPFYTYAGIREGACIYADVPLFGREAGEPLNDKFVVKSYSPQTWIRVSYPEFDILANGYEEELSTDFDEVYKIGSAIFSFINDGFVFSFKEYPEEKHDSITFTIEIPIEGEYFQLKFNGKDYPESYYTYEHRVLRNDNRVLKGSVTVKFDNPL